METLILSALSSWLLLLRSDADDAMTKLSVTAADDV
jgi:hypothetical protein